MEFLGIGLPELFFIILIALIVLGPKDMVKAGRTLGAWLRNLVTSPGWQAFLKTSHEIRTLPNRLMREAGIDEFEKVTRETARAARLPDLPNTIGPPAGVENPASPPPPAPERDGPKPGLGDEPHA